MGKENYARYSGPISVNEKMAELYDPKLRFLESYPNERGYIMMSGLFLSAIEQEKEKMIGYIIFSWISPNNNIACLNENYVIEDHVKHVPNEAKNLFMTKEIWCSKLAFFVISEENRRKGIGRFLLLEGMACMNEKGIKEVVIHPTKSSRGFYEKHGATSLIGITLSINTEKVVAQNKNYLQEVMQR